MTSAVPVYILFPAEVVPALPLPGTLIHYVCCRSMTQRADFNLAGLRDPIGLCATCRHARVVHSSHGSTFYLCRLAEIDPRFDKYPRLPVLRCAGYARAEEAGDS